MNSNLVTVVVPCFNDGRFVREAVESALISGRSAGLEPSIIVVDDGSTDSETLRVLSELPISVRVLTQENKGAACARAQGAKNSHSEWVIFLDADNILTTLYFEVLTKRTHEISAANVVFGDYEIFGVRTEHVAQRFDLKSFVNVNCIDNCALVRRTTLERLNYGVKCDSNLHEDWLLWLHFIVRGATFQHVNGVAFKYRSRSDSKSTLATQVRRAAFERESLGVRLDMINARLASVEVITRYAFNCNGHNKIERVANTKPNIIGP